MIIEKQSFEQISSYFELCTSESFLELLSLEFELMQLFS